MSKNSNSSSEEERNYSDEDINLSKSQKKMISKKTKDDFDIPVSKNFQKNISGQMFSKYVNLDPLDFEKNYKISQNALNVIKDSEIKVKIKNKDKNDRATVEQVLDPRTRVILFKFLKNNFINEINGCLSTGKEANVYHALSSNKEEEFAIKIYKTSILIFKDRSAYVEGEFRFRHVQTHHNPRKMVALWAEKEFRNLKRIRLSEISCPEPVVVKSNVLVMKFIGKDMNPAKKLKDIVVEQEKWNELYLGI